MDNKELLKYVVAFTYGDGHLAYHGKECRFEATCIIDNLDYINWRKSILENIAPVVIYDNSDKREDFNRKPLIKTTTRCHPIYTKIHDRLYLNNRKTFDPHYLKLFDWETMAIFYMDDGSFVISKDHYKDKTYRTNHITLATNCFTYAENLLLKETIKKNLEIEFNIHKHSFSKNLGQTHILVLANSSHIRFLENIKNYILPSFQYKINPYDRLVTDNADDGEIVRTLENKI